MFGLSDAESNDLVLIGDVDEIPSGRLLGELRLNPPTGPLVFEQINHYYFFNCQGVGSSRQWTGTVIVPYKLVANSTPQTLRDQKDSFPLLHKGGWHFSFLGGIAGIRAKLEAFAHQEFNRLEFKSDEHIRESMRNAKDLFGREEYGISFELVELDSSDYKEIFDFLCIFPHLVSHSNHGGEM